MIPQLPDEAVWTRVAWRTYSTDHVEGSSAKGFGGYDWSKPLSSVGI